MHVPDPTTVPSPTRLEGEPQKWFGRFLAYVALPPGRRTLESTWRQEHEGAASTGAVGATGSTGQRRPPGAWHRAFVRWQWERRAAEHNAAVFAAEAVEVAEQRRAERTRRRTLVSAFMLRAFNLLADPTLMRAAPASVASAVSRALQESRSEFGCDFLPETDALVVPGAGPDPEPFVEIVIVGAERMNVPGGPVITETSVAPGFKFRRD